jgi:uncharacterized damage-inducible protein DinB
MMDRRLLPLHEILKLNTRLFFNALKGVDDELANRRILDEVNPIIFVACHMMEARFALAGLLGSEAEAPYRELLDVTDISLIREYPPLEGVRQAWGEVSESLEELLPAATEEALASSTSFPYPVDDKTALGGVAFLLQHEAYHIGQLGVLRRALGLEAMRWTQ